MSAGKLRICFLRVKTDFSIDSVITEVGKKKILNITPHKIFLQLMEVYGYRLMKSELICIV